MIKVKNLIIGAGISGLTYANYINDDYLIIEKEDSAGGYCKTIIEGDYIWDYAGHFFHFKEEEFKKKFIDSLDASQYVTKDKKTYIYYNNSLIDYPFQMNIHELPKEEFIACLYDLFNKKEKEKYDNFLDMLYGKFGASIVEKFLKPYNEKLYACDLKKLDVDAMGRFFPYADLKAIIENMKNGSSKSYNDTFLYPKKGAQVIIDILLTKIPKEKIKLNAFVKSIDLKNKTVVLNDGEKIEYERLINTIPFNQFLKLTNNKEYSDLSDKLTYNQVLVFNLGFDKKSSFNKESWIYFPDKDINFYRVGFYDNILNGEKLSMYIEIGYAKDYQITKEEIKRQLDLTLSNLKKVGITDDSFNLKAEMSIVMNPAYVHIDTKNNLKIKEIMAILAQNNVYSIGRYGGWTYCSMEDCMLEAKNLAQK